eukprot:311633-Chlamydomonas_euryale.AAC.6
MLVRGCRISSPAVCHRRHGRWCPGHGLVAPTMALFALLKTVPSPPKALRAACTHRLWIKVARGVGCVVAVSLL